MKLSSKIRVIVMCLSLAVAFPLLAQQVEKKVAGKTYVYDYDKKKVYNKKRMPVKEDFSCEGYKIEDNTLIKEVFRAVLGTKRIDELRDKSVLMSFVCKADGRVEYMKFLFPNGIFLTPEEVSKLEDKFLSVRFPVTLYKPGIKRVAFGQACRFSTL